MGRPKPIASRLPTRLKKQNPAWDDRVFHLAVFIAYLQLEKMCTHFKTQLNDPCIYDWVYNIEQYVSHRALKLCSALIYSSSAAPIGACALSYKILSAFFMLGISFSELLFLLHVRAIYTDNKPARYFFVFLWACSAASCTTPVITAFSTPFVNIGPTNYCIGSTPPAYVGASVIVPFINDTVLFLSLAWRLQEGVYIPERETAVFKGVNVVAGRYLPCLSRALFQNGQAYFL